jgi:hypothetical protein
VAVDATNDNPTPKQIKRYLIDKTLIVVEMITGNNYNKKVG